MINIGVYPFIDSSYTKFFEEEAYILFPLEEEFTSNERTETAAIILDHTDKLSEESVGQICELLLSIKGKKIPLVFVLLKESSKVERSVLLQLGATIVFDRTTEPREFEMIVSNLLGQKYKRDTSMLDVKKVGGRLELNSHNLSVDLGDERQVSLTPLEYKLLSFLKSKQEKTSTYDEIHQAIWGDKLKNKRYRIANLVFKVRNKIEADVEQPKYLKTIRTIGYTLYS